MRIVYGGFLHETNTFAPSRAGWEDFVTGGGWPGYSEGEQVWSKIAGSNIPAAGFVEKALADGHDIVPTVWTAASPSGPVTRDAYEKIASRIVEGIRDALPVDAVYLDLHGAMVAEHFDDGEGELLRRVRAVVGPDLPIAVSIDLHANVTEAMLSLADIVVAYRTYPHVDMADTGVRTYDLLLKRIARGKKQPIAIRRLPYLIPICWQTTDFSPAKDLYALLESLENADSHISFTTAFPAADFAGCTPVIWAYADTQAEADALADKLEAAALEAEALFAGKAYEPDEAVRYAAARATDGVRPVVIADAQDNPGAGGNSDTTGLLKALVRNNAQRAAIGLIVDPEAVKRIHEAGAGACIRLALGGHSGIPGDEPLEEEFLIESISDGKFKAYGPYYRGFNMDVGPSACLRIGDVRVVVASYKVQMADTSMFRFAGIDPEAQDILVVKSAAHFRADFTPIAGEIIVAAAPGFMPVDLSTLPWKHLPAGVRLNPLGQPFTPPSAD